MDSGDGGTWDALRVHASTTVPGGDAVRCGLAVDRVRRRALSLYFRYFF